MRGGAVDEGGAANSRCQEEKAAGNAAGEEVQEMPVTMICPNLKCGRTLVAADSLRGKVVACPYCDHSFVVPKPSAVPQAQADSAAGREVTPADGKRK